MNQPITQWFRRFLGGVAIPGTLIAGSLALAGCIFEQPLMPEPAADIEPKFLKSYQSDDGKRMVVASWSNREYVVVFDGRPFRAIQSMPFGDGSIYSVQTLETDDRKYAYFWMESDASGDRLSVRMLDPKKLPNGAATLPGVVARSLSEPDARNELFTDPIDYTAAPQGR